MTATTAQRRDAWLALVQSLERLVIATRENAHASRKLALAIQEECGAEALTSTPEEWEATAWAAGRLLEGLTRLPAPEIPEDPAEGQEAIPMPGETVQEVLVGAEQMGRRLRNAMRPLPEGESTVVENPGEDPPCPDCGGDPKDGTLHAEGCPRIDTPGQFGPPWPEVF